MGNLARGSGCNYGHVAHMKETTVKPMQSIRIGDIYSRPGGNHAYRVRLKSEKDGMVGVEVYICVSHRYPKLYSYLGRDWLLNTDDLFNDFNLSPNLNLD